jgi:hypothetical protein
MSVPNTFKFISTASAAALLSLAAMGGVANAQPSGLGSPNTNAVGNLAGVGVGNGMDRGKPIFTTRNGSTPLVGAGVLSGQPNHNGSAASVSLLNTNRLVGASRGPVGSNGVNVANPSHAPVLSGATQNHH